jgi:hypothetical protein
VERGAGSVEQVEAAADKDFHATKIGESGEIKENEERRKEKGEASTP